MNRARKYYRCVTNFCKSLVGDPQVDGLRLVKFWLVTPLRNTTALQEIRPRDYFSIETIERMILLTNLASLVIGHEMMVRY